MDTSRSAKPTFDGSSLITTKDGRGVLPAPCRGSHENPLQGAGGQGAHQAYPLQGPGVAGGGKAQAPAPPQGSLVCSQPAKKPCSLQGQGRPSPGSGLVLAHFQGAAATRTKQNIVVRSTYDPASGSVVLTTMPIISQRASERNMRAKKVHQGGSHALRLRPGQVAIVNEVIRGILFEFA